MHGDACEKTRPRALEKLPGMRMVGLEPVLLLREETLQPGSIGNHARAVYKSAMDPFAMLAAHPEKP